MIRYGFRLQTYLGPHRGLHMKLDYHSSAVKDYVTALRLRRVGAWKDQNQKETSAWKGQALEKPPPLEQPAETQSCEDCHGVVWSKQYSTL